MNFEQIACESTNYSASRFWKAIAIWMRNPHVVNRRILASQDLFAVEVNCNISDIHERIHSLQIRPDYFECDTSLAQNQKHLLDALNIAEHCQSVDCTNLVEVPSNDKIYLYVRKSLPRNTQLFSSILEFVLIDKRAISVTSFHKCIVQDKRFLGPDTAYSIEHREYDSTCIRICKSEDRDYDKSRNWLGSKFLPRLIKWMACEDDDSAGPRVASLGLISVEKYNQLYNRLKEKYGSEMVKIWPENTDPAKFVYEDVAIATYLLLLWEKERLEKDTRELQSFVDLGCGNGLLVHILSSEGHAGTGLDLRRRKIWDLYPESTCLQVSTIVPSCNTVFPGADWIIGNHSDELTPWIPVIASRSSYECRFFLLPCCAYEFDGSKYRRCNASESQYSEYMSYVKNVCENCGFVTHVDRLRIPSTKRICFIGWRRNYAKENSETLDANIQRFINAKSTTSHRDKILIDDTAKNNELWSSSFRPRSPMERVRNCTQLDRTLVLNIVNIVAENLLRAERRIPLEWKPGETWNAGRKIELGNLAKLIAPEMLQQLRKECGGLQTLLRNHNHIFYVVQGKVQFRIPGSKEPDKKRKRRNNGEPLRKVKPCWFYQNHPDGCPALEVDCDFQHEATAASRCTYR